MDGPSCWLYNLWTYSEICDNIRHIGKIYNNYTLNDCVQMKRTEMKDFGKNVAK